MKVIFIVLLTLKLIDAKSVSIKQSLLDAANELQEAQAEEEGQVYNKSNIHEKKGIRQNLDQDAAPADHQRALTEEIQQFVKQAHTPRQYAVRRRYTEEFSTPTQFEDRISHDYRWKQRKPERKPSNRQHKNKQLFPLDEVRELNNYKSIMKMNPYFRDEIFGKERQVAAELAQRAFQNGLIRPANTDDDVLGDELDEDLDDVDEDPKEGIYSEFPDDNEIENNERSYNYNDLNMGYY